MSMRNWARVMGVEPKDGENDEALRARLSGFWDMRRGTLASMDSALTDTIDRERSVAVGTDQIKSLIAIHWLRASKPDALFARLAWYWRTMRALWGKR